MKDVKSKLAEDNNKEKNILLFKRTTKEIPAEVLAITNKLNVDGISIELLK
jgi:hypothetical protein